MSICIPFRLPGLSDKVNHAQDTNYKQAVSKMLVHTALQRRIKMLVLAVTLTGYINNNMCEI